MTSNFTTCIKSLITFFAELLYTSHTQHTSGCEFKLTLQSHNLCAGYMLCSAPAMDRLTADASRSCNKFSVICLKFIFSQLKPLIHQLSATSISLNTTTIVKRLNKPLYVLRGKTHKSEVPTLPCTEINPQTKPLNNHIRMKHAQLTCLQTSRIIMINLLIKLSFLDKPPW